jgi:hypothetical protein
MRPPPFEDAHPHALHIGPEGQCLACEMDRSGIVSPSPEVAADLAALTRPCVVPPPAPLLDRIVSTLHARFHGAEVHTVIIYPEETGRPETLLTVYVERDGGRGWKRCADASGATLDLAVEDLARLVGVQ